MIKIKKLSLCMRKCFTWFKVIIFFLGEIIFMRRIFIVDTFRKAMRRYGLKE